MHGAEDAISLTVEGGDAIVGARTLDAFVDEDCELHKIYKLRAYRGSGAGTLLASAPMIKVQPRGVREMSVKVTGRTREFWRRCWRGGDRAYPRRGFVVTIPQ